MQGLDALRERFAVRPEGHCLLGLSGGADSVALLYLLLPDVRNGRLKLSAVHVNHGLRGAEADEDERFAGQLCDTHGIPYFIRRADLRGKTDEETARDARYTCFCECMKDTGADALLLAHHRDDLAETFLMRLMRGAGPDGLGCMQAESMNRGMKILRPLLQIGKDELKQLLAGNGIPWREDASNADTGYLRNAVRHELLPRMEAMSAGAGKRLAQTACLISEENMFLDRQAEEFLNRYAGEDWIETVPLRGTGPAMAARILRRWWRRWAPPLQEHALSFAQTQELLALAYEERGTVNLPAGCRASAGKCFLHLTDGTVPSYGTVPCTGQGGRLGPYMLEAAGPAAGPGDGKLSQAVPEGFLQGCVLRTRLPGDRITPFGMRGSKKLQDYLTDRGIDAAWRDRIPLLCRDREVLLAAGVGAGNIPVWNGNERYIRLEWHGSMPWAGESERERHG